MAVSLLKATKEFKGANLVRTRDATKLAECDIVVDVGGVYDPATHRYDHHQVRNEYLTERIKGLIDYLFF